MELKENTGMIFRNEYKKDNEKAPDFKGKIDWKGETIEIALWNNPPKDGKKGYFGVKLSEPYVAENNNKQNPGEIEKVINPESDIDSLPF